MKLAAATALAVLFAFPAGAESMCVSPGTGGPKDPSTFAELRPTPTPGAEAEVLFSNSGWDGADVDIVCRLSLGGLSVGVAMYLGRGGAPDSRNPRRFMASPLSVASLRTNHQATGAAVAV